MHSLILVTFLIAFTCKTAQGAVQTLFPTSDRELVSCTIETLVWRDDGAHPLLNQMGMMDIVLSQGDTVLRTLATVDAMDMSAAVLLPCHLPPASDYYLEYIPHSSATIPPCQHELQRPLTAPGVLPSSLSTSVSSKRTAPSSTSTGTGNILDGGFDLLTAEAPLLWKTTSPSVTPRPTVTSPTRASVANRAVPSREVGIHPGLIIMWVGVMCSMVML